LEPDFTQMTPEEWNRQHWVELQQGHYFRNHPNYGQNRTHGQLVQPLLGMVNPKMSVLDFGCGYGRVMDHLLPRCKSIMGVDVCQEVLSEARGYLHGRGWSGQQFELRTTDDWERWQPAWCDRVSLSYSINVFQHIPLDYGDRLIRHLADTSREVMIQLLVGDPTEGTIWAGVKRRGYNREPRHPRTREAIRELGKALWGIDRSEAREGRDKLREGFQLIPCPYEVGSSGAEAPHRNDALWVWLHGWRH
jgi:SAM-dependent methyltransferase